MWWTLAAKMVNGGGATAKMVNGGEAVASGERCRHEGERGGDYGWGIFREGELWWRTVGDEETTVGV